MIERGPQIGAVPGMAGADVTVLPGPGELPGFDAAMFDGTG